MGREGLEDIVIEMLAERNVGLLQASQSVPFARISRRIQTLNCFTTPSMSTIEVELCHSPFGKSSLKKVNLSGRAGGERERK
jgi:hypothetical protein